MCGQLARPCCSGGYVAGHGRQISTRSEADLLGKEYAIEKGVISRSPGKRGEPYTVLDQHIFIVLEAHEDHPYTILMKNITVISDLRDCFIELTHRDSDPGSWVVRRWKKFMWFRKRISSDWFADRQQALAFGNQMKREHVALSHQPKASLSRSDPFGT